jgi:hypothetical protein
MKPHPEPKREGWFWAKLVHPRNMPSHEDWASHDWEVVEVIENHIDEDDDGEKWAVFVGGIGPLQWTADFIWGPEVIKPDELK